MAVAAYREKAVTVCTIETSAHIRFKGVNVTKFTSVWRKCKYIDHVAFEKSTKRIDALYDFSSQSPEERSIFRQISMQASHQGLKAQGHNAALDPCFAFSSTLSLYCRPHYQHSYLNSNFLSNCFFTYLAFWASQNRLKLSLFVF